MNRSTADDVPMDTPDTSMEAGLMPRRLLLSLAGATIAVAMAAVPVAADGNPSGTGPPSQSCQDQLTAGGMTPGYSALSPGSPFNEPGFGSVTGGTGGLNYSESSQYDVACYQVTLHH
jgi:hypothetical protein